MSFSKPKSVFLQILRASSMSRKITTLYERDQSNFRQVLVIFETTNRFFLKFCMTLQYDEMKLYILSTEAAYQSKNLVKFHLSSQKS